MAHESGFDSRATNTSVAGPGEGISKAGTDVADDGRVRLLPFLREMLSNLTKEGVGFSAKKTTSGDSKRHEGATLGTTGLEMLLLLLLLLFGTKNGVRVPVAIGLGMEVHNGEVHDAVSGQCVEASDAEVPRSPVELLGVAVGAAGEAEGESSAAAA